MAPDPQPTVDVDVIVTAAVPTPRAYVFRPSGGNRLTHVAGVLNPRAETIPSPCLSYVVRHPTAGTLLIDTGLHPDASKNLRRDFGLPMSLLFRNIRPASVPYVEQLRALGVEADQVERVVMTHLHVDHTSAMRLLPNAEFVCSRREWATAHGRGAGARGFVAHHLPPESRMQLVDFDDGVEPWGAFRSAVDLLGDGTIRLLFTPGHTPGHLSVLLRTETDRHVLVIGDAVYTLESLREERLPLLTADDEQYRDTLRQLKAFSESDASAFLIPSHDPDAWRQLERNDSG